MSRQQALQLTTQWPGPRPGLVSLSADETIKIPRDSLALKDVLRVSLATVKGSACPAFTSIFMNLGSRSERPEPRRAGACACHHRLPILYYPQTK